MARHKFGKSSLCEDKRLTRHQRSRERRHGIGRIAYKTHGVESATLASEMGSLCGKEEQGENESGAVVTTSPLMLATSPDEHRSLSLPNAVRAFGGLQRWNQQPALAQRLEEMEASCTATTVAEALEEVGEIVDAGDSLKAYCWLRQLLSRDPELGYATVLADTAKLLPIAYTPTVGAACQAFGTIPLQRRGCYIDARDAGKIAASLREYAACELDTDPSGKPICDCIVFSDGGRILGLGDLGTWGMGIPLGKLDLYTVCGGFDPMRTIPVIIDAGCGGPEKNTAGLTIRDHELYTGARVDRETQQSDAGTTVNSAYHGTDSAIGAFMKAATDLFGRNCLLQFEDFASADAFPLLAEYRDKYLCYNDDIQGTAAVALAGILGGLRLRSAEKAGLLSQLQKERFLLHGAGAANLGTADLLIKEAGVDKDQVFMTNSRGLIWSDGDEGTFRSREQAEFSFSGRPDFACTSADLNTIVAELKPSCLIGAVGVAPGCFDKEIIEQVVDANSSAPIVFALSNPQTQAEVTARDCYTWSRGRAIYGSGTQFDSVEIEGKTFAPGQVNNVYIFPGLSFGACRCEARNIPDRLFLVAAEAVANSLDDEDIAVQRVLPHRNRLREVSLNVATAVAMEAQRLGIAGVTLGETEAQVKDALLKTRWAP